MTIVTTGFSSSHMAMIVAMMGFSSNSHAMIVKRLGFSSSRMAITIAMMDLVVVTLQWLLWQWVLNSDTTIGPNNAISHFLTLPKLLPTVIRQIMEEPLIDYSKYIMMTSDHYICVLE